MEFNEDGDFPEHMLPPERMHQPRSRRPLWFLPLGRLLLIVAVIVPVYLVLSRIALKAPWLWWVFSQPWQTVAVAAGALFIGEVLVRWRLAARRWRKVECRAREQMNLGQLHEAGRLLDEFCRTAEWWRLYHAQAVLLRAEVFLRQDRGRRAFALLAAVQNSHMLDGRGQRRRRARLQILAAFCFAARKDLDAAEQWAGFAHVTVPPEQAAALLPLELAIALRRGRHAVVLKDAEDGWAQAERALDKHTLACLAVLCAMAARRLDRPTPLDVEEKIARWLQTARDSVSPLDWLGGGWPEMGEFLRLHGLAAGKDAPVPQASSST